MNAAIRDRALTLLSYRAHSRRELFDKLRRKGVPEGADLDEVLEICTAADGLLPCVDFGHLYARSLGALDGEEAVESMLDRMVRVLGEETASRFHSHFSKIAFTRGGEARHLIFDQEEFGPDPLPLCRSVARRGWSPIIICESAGTQDLDALTMKALYTKSQLDWPATAVGRGR